MSSDQTISIDALRQKALALGFSDLRVSDTNLQEGKRYLDDWLAQGRHGDMHYMQEHADLRAHPEKLHPGVIRVITVRMDYLASDADQWQEHELSRIDKPEQALVAMYARGRDYHKVLRQRLQQLAEGLQEDIGELGYRVFVDSAPVMEVELAKKSGLGWRGKHTLLLHRDAGSMFFLGEIYIDAPLPVDEPITDHCGSCQACIDCCPTQAIVAPYQLDARRCISYLTIEHKGSIPLELREKMGNRIYGCDDCQLVCPWNKYAKKAQLPDFQVRHQLDQSDLLTLWAWDENEFLKKTEGSAIRRIGYQAWRRNLAVGMGNALRSKNLNDGVRQQMIYELKLAHKDSSDLVREHIEWALAQACT